VPNDLHTRSRLPEGFLQDAIDTVHSKLTAKKTEFFAWRGEVVDHREVEDTAAQLRAADTIVNIAGLYTKEQAKAPSAPTVALEIDSKTGIVRLVVGVNHEAAPLVAGDAPLAFDASDTRKLPPAEQLTTSGTYPGAHSGFDAPPEEVPQVVKVKRGRMPLEVYEALFGNP
jgi:hypothetical protein